MLPALHALSISYEDLAPRRSEENDWIVAVEVGSASEMRILGEREHVRIGNKIGYAAIT
jgi:hypothetical protein